jgi:ring-1,2-phenylacetyl-CoA epoxidase subunit PaaD
MVTTATLELDMVTKAVASVVDPEIPVLTIEELGILRSVNDEDGQVVVTITPTYSGCPAMRQIEDDIMATLRRIGVDDAEVRMTFSPAWTTDWISEEGHRKLAEFGIAPPTDPAEVVCPRCAGDSPRLVAQFASTACKALMVCSSCGEPFGYFKPHR